MKSGFLEKMAFYLSCMVIGTVPAYSAAVQPWVWPFYAVGVLWTNFAYIGDARGTYINRNHFAGFVEMVFPSVWDTRFRSETGPLKRKNDD